MTQDQNVGRERGNEGGEEGRIVSGAERKTRIDFDLTFVLFRSKTGGCLSFGACPLSLGCHLYYSSNTFASCKTSLCLCKHMPEGETAQGT